MNSSAMILDPSVTGAFLSFTERFEGFTTWLYLDTKGLVTIGYGCLVDPNVPAAIDFRDRTGLPASSGAVAKEWTMVKGLQARAPLGGGAFRDVTNLRATIPSLNQLAFSKLDSDVATLLAYFPALRTYPAPAQLGIISMAWAMGPNFSQTFPRFCAAVLKGDWAGASMECGISTKGNPGVIARNTATRGLFLDAAAGKTLLNV